MCEQVEADDGTVGVGVTIGGEPACYIVEKHLSRFVEGQDPRDVELMWDQMFRATLNYGRKGLPIQVRYNFVMHLKHSQFSAWFNPI